MLPRKRPYGRQRGRTHPEAATSPGMKPALDGRLKKVLAEIGVPEEAPFKPDPFQLEALAAVSEGDCLVTAPTGAGKTWIAREAIARERAAGNRAWYATPLKALSNAKFQEFAAYFGPEQVGILTGDRHENPDAPIVVGTTEILRNQLYDAMHRGERLASDFVVLDEAHFLGDEERGVVWEEVMIYLPHRIPLLMLSATVGNARFLADWLSAIRGRHCRVVSETHRPVPLYPLFLHPGGTLLPLAAPVGEKGRSRLDGKVLSFINSPKEAAIAASRRLPPFGAILQVLRRFRLLPAIFFLKSRADCDAALGMCRENEAAVSDRRSIMLARIDTLAGDNANVRFHRQRRDLERLAVGAHHSGQLPAWKLLMETLMIEGFLDAIFATSTVAAGVNFPARSIVLLNSDRFNGRDFLPLTATEFHQMAGRAGRRGMDRIGFAIVVPGAFMDLRHLARLLNAAATDVTSQIRVNFSMVLNLLLSHRPAEIEDLLSRSLAAFSLRRRSEADSQATPLVSNLDRLVQIFREHLAFLQVYDYVNATGLLTESGLWASRLRVDQPLLIAEALRHGLMPDDSPSMMAGFMAAFVNDRETSERFDRRHTPKPLLSRFLTLKRGLRPFAQHLFAGGFAVRPLLFRPALALHAWAGGESWEDVCRLAELEEGNLANLVLRTADHLRHVRALADTFPRAAAAAGEAAERIMRQPVVG